MKDIQVHNKSSTESFQETCEKYFHKGEFGFISNSSSELLVISFSGLEGRPPFQFYGTLRDIGVNALFLCDINKNWYNRGLSCFGNNIKDTLTVLYALTKYFDKDKIFFIGGSMGGYGAILFSALLGFGNVLAFSPQIVLKPLWSWCPKKEEDLIYYDISNLNYKNVNLTVISSESPIDIFALSKISSVQCKTGRFFSTNHKHNIAKVLKTKNILNCFFQTWVESGEISFLDLKTNLLLDIQQNTTLEKLLDTSYKASWGEATQPTHELTILNKDWYYLDYYSARVYFYTHNFKSSYYHIERGLSRSPDYVSFYGLKAAILLINGMDDEVFSIYDRTLYLIQYESFSKVNFYLHVATLVTKVGKRRVAINLRTFIALLLIDTGDILQIRSNQYQIGRLYFAIGSLKKSRETFNAILKQNISDWMQEKILAFYLPQIIHKLNPIANTNKED